MSSNAVRWKSITGDMNKAGVTPPWQPIHTRYDAPKTWKFTLRIGAHSRRQSASLVGNICLEFPSPFLFPFSSTNDDQSARRRSVVLESPASPLLPDPPGFETSTNKRSSIAILRNSISHQRCRHPVKRKRRSGAFAAYKTTLRIHRAFQHHRSWHKSITYYERDNCTCKWCRVHKCRMLWKRRHASLHSSYVPRS